jgi:hypothetical protein
MVVLVNQQSVRYFAHWPDVQVIHRDGTHGVAGDTPPEPAAGAFDACKYVEGCAGVPKQFPLGARARTLSVQEATPHTQRIDPGHS